MASTYGLMVIGFSRPKAWFSPLSWLIRAFDSFAPFSHVYLQYMDRRTGECLVYEASFFGVRFVNKHIHMKKVKTVSRELYYLSDEQQLRLEKICQQYTGSSYGVTQILGMAVQILFRLKKNPLADGDASNVCSELILRILEEVYKASTGLDKDSARPSHVFKYLKYLRKDKPIKGWRWCK